MSRILAGVSAIVALVTVVAEVAVVAIMLLMSSLLNSSPQPPHPVLPTNATSSRNIFSTGFAHLGKSTYVIGLASNTSLVLWIQIFCWLGMLILFIEVFT